MKDYGPMEYTGYYGAEGYTLLAMESDSGEARHERRYICLLNNGSMPNGKGCRYNLNEYCCLLIKGTWGKKDNRDVQCRYLRRR